MKYRTRLPADHIAKLRVVAAGPDATRAAACLDALQREVMPDLLEWGRYYFPHYFTMPPSKMHLDFVKDLQWRHTERGIKDARVAPRSGAKTTWASKVYPLFCICHKLESYIQLISDSSDQSWSNLSDIRYELEHNERLAAEYPDACGVGPTWNVQQIVTRNGIKIDALGTGKKIRGRSHRAQRPTLQIPDDLENDKQVGNPSQRKKVLSWLQRAVIPAGGPSTNILFVGTAMHPADAIQTVSKLPGWRFSTYAAIVREPDNQDLWDIWRAKYRDVSIKPQERERICRAFYEGHKSAMDFGAELLWPEREPLYDLMCWRETNGELAFQSEKQGNPNATANTEFPPEFFDDRHIWFETWPDLICKVMALDPSKGTNEKNDFSAYVMAGLGADGNIYIEGNLERRDAMKVVTDGVRLYREFSPTSLSIETMMFQELFQHMFRAEAARLGMLLAMRPVHQSIDKGVRIRELTPYLWGGQLKFKTGSTGTTELVKQLKEFPTGEHDDGPDALHMAICALVAATHGDGGQDSVSMARG